jgi:cellulose synthase/poly-beta-1,6-N-acetylglucosamine synthase-like glycosyltransferase
LIWLLTAWVIVGALFLGVPAGYFFYMRRRSSSVWNLKINRNYVPSTTILIPVHNEEKIIRYKLENISKVNYPKDKIDIIVVNDSSTDNTIAEVNCYIQDCPNQNIKLFNIKEHMGKTGCLNNALKTICSDVVIISDVDCFWPSDILTKAISYLSDPKVGAITARELLLNPTDSWVTLGEQFYDSNIQSVRIGESKLHSTIFFQGGFAAYKRSTLEEFNHATDDSGTALDIVQANKRALLIPEIGFFTLSPTKWKHKVTIKLRRASHLQHLWARCLNLLIHGKLAMPKRIAVPEIVLHIFNPVLLVLFGALSVAVMVVYPLFATFLLAGLVGMFVVKKTRVTVFELLQNNLILFASLFSFFGNRQIKIWQPVQESRSVLSEKLLRENQLI